MSGRTNQVTHKSLGAKFLTFYQRVEGQTKLLMCAFVEIQNVLLATGGRTNQATYKCLDKKFKSYYLRVE